MTQEYELAVIRAAREYRQAHAAYDAWLAKGGFEPDPNTPPLIDRCEIMRDRLISAALAGEFMYEAQQNHAIHEALRMNIVTLQCSYGHTFDVMLKDEPVSMDCPHCESVRPGR